MLSNSLRRCIFLALASVLAASCSSDSKDSNPRTKETPPKEAPGALKQQEVDRRIKVEIGGARQARFEGVVKVKVAARVGEGEQKSFSVAAVEPVGFVPVGNGTELKLDIGVVSLYRGDGEYTLHAGIGQPAPTTGPTVVGKPGDPSSVSVAAVTFITSGPPATEKRYGYLLEPCKIVLDEEATIGSADCPALVAVDGEKVSLKYSWSK